MDVVLAAVTGVLCVVAVAACAVLCRRAEEAAAKAVEFADAADIDAASARGERNRAFENACHAAECAEVVKTEVAKLETLVAKLNRERAENPPFVAITYSEDTGDPVKAVVASDPAPSPDFTACATLPAGVPFGFTPTQVHPTVIEGSE